MNLTKPLVNLAILETLKNSDFRDEIDLFVPYIAISIGRLSEVPFVASDLKNRLKEDFGIDAPEAAVEVLMARAKSRKLIKLENHTYFPVHENIAPWIEKFREGESSVDESIGLVAKGFVKFADEKYGKNINEDDAVDLIYDFMRENIGDSALISIRKSATLAESIKNPKHLTASYIAYLHEARSELWPKFELVTRAVMMAGYIGYANQISAKKEYSKISVYLDTPILMGLLGYSGDSKAKTLQEMLGLLNSFRINIKIFDITLREIEGIMSAWINDLRARNYVRFNPKTLEMLRQKKIDFAALETDLTLLQGRIEGFGVVIDRTFVIDAKYNCDVVALEERIKSEFKGKAVDPRHDADVLNRIMSSRRGVRISTLNQEFKIFVTPNGGLVDIGQDFFGSLDRSIPYAVTDRWITTMFWFKHPEIFKDLPVKMLVSSAYGAIFADNGFWKKFTEKLESLQKRKAISEEDFILVRYDADLLLSVHELSVDRGLEFTDNDVFEIVDYVKKKNLEEKDKAIGELEAASREKVEAISGDLIAAKIKLDSTHLKINRLARFVGSSVAMVACFFIVASVFWVAYVGMPTEAFGYEISETYKKGTIALFAAVITGIFGLLGTMFGCSVQSVYLWIRSTVENRLNSALID